ncbi:AAA family ATPase [Lampropedia puyangensis]|uniref:AAA family ATPase n=1 Tax=Lampropedia puyangensis TaxID=1330072 RepID=A0A4S8EPL7_9BURK|nr:AAA family ATPase [Lampropedia puyangensis]THT96050.1 AAA family ATPase [Lampropedia puyangensis]
MPSSGRGDLDQPRPSNYDPASEHGASGYSPISRLDFTDEEALTGFTTEEVSRVRSEKALSPKLQRLVQVNEPFAAISPETEPFDSFSVGEFDYWPELQWMVEGLFHCGSLVMVWGPSGAGKTAWLIDLTLAIAHGRSWAGRGVKKTGALYCVLEGGYGFRKRVQAAIAHHKIEPDLQLRFMFEPIDLGSTESLNRLAATAARFGCQLIIIDTLAAALAGKADESSNQHMAEIIDNAKRLTMLTGATVILTHHTGHNQSHERGATALRGGVDTSISINRKNERRFWRVEKQRDGEDGFGGDFELVSADSSSDMTGSGIIVQHGMTLSKEQIKSSSKKQKSNPNHARVFEAINNLWLQQTQELSSEERAAHTILFDECVKAGAAAVQVADPKKNGRRSAQAAIRALAKVNRLQIYADNRVTLAASPLPLSSH